MTPGIIRDYGMFSPSKYLPVTGLSAYIFLAYSVVADITDPDTKLSCHEHYTNIP